MRVAEEVYSLILRLAYHLIGLLSAPGARKDMQTALENYWIVVLGRTGSVGTPRPYPRRLTQVYRISRLRIKYCTHPLSRRLTYGGYRNARHFPH